MLDSLTDLKAILSSGGEAAEQVVFVPATGQPRTIWAIVDRNPDSDPDGIPGASTNDIEIFVANDATTGIETGDNKPDTGGDQVRVTKRYGGTAKAMNIQRIILHDDALVQLGLR